MFDVQKIREIPITTVATDLGFQISASGRGRCRLPDHEDRNPSFAIKNAANSFRCFACGRGGSVIDLVAQMLNLDFAEACRWLSERYLSGAARMPQERPTARRPRSTLPSKVTKSSIPPEFSPDSEIYGWVLQNSPLQSLGEQYLMARGFRKSTIEYFKIGQIGDSLRLSNLALKTFGRERLRRCGILTTSKSGDTFVFSTKYLLFPFYCGSEVVYLQTRRADAISIRRWICLAKILPPVYNSNALSTYQSTITICEGLTDVLSAHQLGKSAIGLLGANSSLPRDVIELLQAKNVEIIADADPAGNKLTQRLVSELALLGITVVSRRLPHGCNDLNDFLRLQPPAS